MRSSSAPPSRPLTSGEGGEILQAGGNPFWSEKAKMDHLLKAARPSGLPEQSPGSEGLPISDAAHLGQCVGKGRGSSSKPMFVTPPSKVSGLSHGAEAAVFHGKRTEGRVPCEPGDDVKLDSKGDSGFSNSNEDSLQRACEQNAKLMSELEWLRQQKSSPESGDGSTQSWVKVPSDGMREGRDGNGGDGRECATPRCCNSGQFGQNCRFTPNGTRVPENTPPSDPPVVPEPPILPPVPPFPTLADDVASGMLDHYEVTTDGSKMRLGERAWKPHGDKSAEPTPGEARAFWLEREVVALKQSLAKMTQGNPFRSNEYWSNGFQPPPGPSLTGLPDVPADLGRPDPDR
eukprot:s1206_g28.t1